MWPALLFQLFSPVDAAQLATLHEQRIAAAPPVGQRAAKRDLGLFWLRNGRPEQAERWLRQVLPGDDVLPFLAEAVAAQGHDALPLFTECAKVNARCLTRLAELDRAGALQHYEAAVAREPTPARRNDLGQALQAAGRMPEAERQFRQALAEQSSQPNHPETATTKNNLG